MLEKIFVVVTDDGYDRTEVSYFVTREKAQAYIDRFGGISDFLIVEEPLGDDDPRLLPGSQFTYMVDIEVFPFVESEEDRMALNLPIYLLQPLSDPGKLGLRTVIEKPILTHLPTRVYASGYVEAEDRQAAYAQVRAWVNANYTKIEQEVTNRVF